MANVQNAYSQSVPPSVNAATTIPPFAQPVNAIGAANGASPYGGMSSAPNFPQAMPQMQSGHMNMPQANPTSQGGAPTPEQLQQQVQIIQMLQAQGVPHDQWAAVLSALMAAGAGGANAAAAPTQQNWGQNQYGGREDMSRDRNGYNDPYSMRSPSGRHRRSRSRSPSGYDRRRDPSPRRRRDSPTYGAYGRGDDRSARSGNSYRQRSPDRYRRSDSPRGRDHTLPPSGPKTISWDPSMPPEHIKGKSLKFSLALRHVLTIAQFSAELFLSEESRKFIISTFRPDSVPAKFLLAPQKITFGKSSRRLASYKHASSTLINDMLSSR